METQIQADIFGTPDDPYEALKIVVMRLGGPKRVGRLLWPDKPLEAASILLNNCLNRERPEKLDLDQIDFLIGEARAADCHVVLQYLGNRHGYSIHAVNPEDERMRLQREILEAAQRLEQAITLLQKLHSPVKAVRGV